VCILVFTQRGGKEKVEMARGQRWHWQSPLTLGVVALALMVVGWKVSTYRPAADTDAERRLVELASQAEAFERANTDPSQAGLAAKLQQYTRPPYHFLGRLLVYVGAALFLVAGVAMWQAKPPPPGEEEEEADDGIDADLRGE
jgi:hypothetical protein